MKKIVLCTCAVCAFVSCCYMVFYFPGELDPTVNAASCNAIQIGMAEKEVDAILGRSYDQWGEGFAGMKEWNGSDGSCITVYFSANGKVLSKEFTSWQSAVSRWFTRARW